MASESSSLLHPALSSDDGGTTDSEIKLPQTFKQTQTSNGATYTISRRRNSVLAGCLPLHIFLTSFLFLAILICLTLTFFPLHLFKAIVPFPTVPKSLQATRDGLLNMVPNRLPTDHSAIPTNAPWSNLLFAAESNAPNAPTQPFHTTPYILSFQQSAGILATSTLFTRTTHTKTTDAQLSVPDIALSALSALDTPLTGAKGPLTIPSHSSMTTVLELLGLKISVTIGDPYLTILATAPGLRITTVNGPWSAITPITLSNGKTVHLITGGEGSDNTWILYAQENTVSTVASDGGIAGLEVTTDKPTIVRLFSLPSHYVTPDDFDYDTLTNGFTQCYPVSSKITSSTRDYGRSGTPVTSSVQFAYEFNYLGSGGECVHEFLTMPHHGVGRNAAAYYSTRDDDVGTLKGVHGPIAVHPVKVRGGQGVLFEEGLEVDDVKPLKSKDFKTASSTALREVEKSLKKLVLSKQSGGTGVVMEQGIYGLGKELARIASETAISYESGGVLYSEGIAVVSEAFEYLFVTDGGQFYYDPKVRRNEREGGVEDGLGRGETATPTPSNTTAPRLRARGRQHGLPKTTKRRPPLVHAPIVPLLTPTVPQVGGIIAKDSAIDLSAEFGAGAYNDHHYHYGYLIYAYSLVLAVEESRSVDLQLEESQTPTRTKYGQYIDALRMDVCHETPTDGRFTTFRHFDFYNSHSWASGLFPMANGKSQESVR